MNGKIRTKLTQRQVLSKYLPEGTIDTILMYFTEYKVKFRIVKPRKTKLGDFRVGPQQSVPEITVNGDLNKYLFLVTTVHEFAHLKTYLDHRFSVSPHGKEWKQNFVNMMLPFLELNVLPKDIENALMQSFVQVKASSCTDIQLHRVLKKYDEFDSNEILLEQISKNSTFVLQNKVFKKGTLRRTRFLCEEIGTGKSFLINALAVVTPIEIDEK